MYRWLWIIFLPLSLGANPSGARTVAGKAEVISTPNEVEVRTSDRAIIEWDQFWIGKGETTRFIQPSSNSAVLNRVTHGVSEIHGLLEANGRVYLVNPRGVVIGKDGVVQTAGFLASTLDIKERDFLLGGDLLFKGKEGGAVLNYGTIETKYGEIILLGRKVDNEGDLKGDRVHIGAGEEILLTQKGMERIFVSAKTEGEKEGTGIENLGSIQASMAELKADGNIYRLAINHEGLVEAHGIKEERGRVFLVAEGGSIHSSGAIHAEAGAVHIFGNEVVIDGGASIDVSGDFGGGEVLVGGHFQGRDPTTPNAKFTHLKEGARVSADARIEGDGGKVILWSDHTTLMEGEIFARGGAEGGDGGFVEVSGFYGLSCTGLVSTFAPKGKMGTLLLDPSDIYIQGTPLSNPYYPCYTNPPTAALVSITFAELQSCLSGSDVVISTTSDQMGGGNIFVSYPGFEWNGSGSLTLLASANITVAEKLLWTGVGSAPSLTLQSGGDTTLFGGNTSGLFGVPGGAVTLIGNTRVNVSSYSTAIYPVSLEGKNISMTASRVEIGSTNANTSVTLNVEDSLSILAGICTIRGSNDSSGGYAKIDLLNPTTKLNINSGGIDILGGAAYGSYAQIVGQAPGQPISLVANSGDFKLIGGGENSYAQITNVSPTIVGFDFICSGGTGQNAWVSIDNGTTLHIGPVQGNFTISGGSGAGAYAQISCEDLFISDLGGDLIVQGGSTSSGAGFAIIGQGGATSISNVMGDIQVAGGFGSGTNYAQIGSQGPEGKNITINGIGGDLLVIGGSSTSGESFAQIGHIPVSNLNFSADIQVTDVQGNIKVLGGTNSSGNFAQIGFAPPLVSAQVTGQGNVLVNGNGNLLIQASRASAIIGHGNPTNTGNFIVQGSVSVEVGGDTQIISSNTSAAGVGYSHNPDQFGQVYADLVSLSSGNITLTGKPGGDAFVGYSVPTNLLDIVQVVRTNVSATNDITLDGQQGFATVGVYAESGIGYANRVDVSAGGNLSLLTAPTFGSRILTNNPTLMVGTYDVSLLGNNIFIGTNGGGVARVYASRDLEAIANVDMVIGSYSALLTGNGDINLVVDNAFPVPPDFGPGRFILNSAALLDSGGLLRIFTSARSQNQIQSLLNGAPFTPGPIYLDSGTERWATYYFNSFGGDPFTIFYKDALSPTFLFEIHHPIVAGMFQNIRPYDDLFFSSKPFLLRYDRACYDLLTLPMGMITSFDLLSEECWESLQQEYRNYQTIR